MLNALYIKGAEIGGGGAKLFRPNMFKLTERDVEKCKRTFKLFEELYEIEMRTGLQDGNNAKDGYPMMRFFFIFCILFYTLDSKNYIYIYFT